jgi:hypothetical protein|nr:MAG TPA: hypothetical protein [Caudoviricetes sp.]
MLKSLREKDKMRRYFEDWYPLVFSIAITAVYGFIFRNWVGSYFNDVLNAVISFASIILGFICALVTLLFSLLSTSIMKIVFDGEYKIRLKRYFVRSCMFGFIVVIFSIILFEREKIFTELNNIGAIGKGIICFTKCLWVFSISYFTLTTYRVISLMIHIAFLAPGEVATGDKVEPEEDEESIINLRKKYEKK